MISVVCVYNKWEVFSECLLTSLKVQTEDYELVAIDNSRNAYRSAAQALNAGGERARGKYIMFVHQDVVLTSSSWLESAERLLDSVFDLGVAGVAGKSQKGPWTLSNIENGSPPHPAGHFRIAFPTVVQTLDECLVIVPGSVFAQHKFDEQVCPDWHLYVVEYCLRLKQTAFQSYVIPLSLYHKSTGFPLPKAYYSTLSNISQKYRGNYRHIYTTCGDWDTRFPPELQRTKPWMYANAVADVVQKTFRKSHYPSDEPMGSIMRYLGRRDSG
jgi:hypothetical protein